MRHRLNLKILKEGKEGSIRRVIGRHRSGLPHGRSWSLNQIPLERENMKSLSWILMLFFSTLSVPFAYVTMRMLGDCFIRANAAVLFGFSQGENTQLEMALNFYRSMLWSGDLTILLVSIAALLILLSLIYCSWRLGRKHNDR